MDMLCSTFSMVVIAECCSTHYFELSRHVPLAGLEIEFEQPTVLVLT